jgi:hypothetical protein
MNLIWAHNQELGTLTCTIKENLSYTTSNGGGTFIKKYNGEISEITSNEEWEAEKNWISDNFSDLVGVYSPQFDITEESWKAANPNWDKALPLFGLSKDGEYIDKLCRTSSMQEGHDMQTVYKLDYIWIEQDKNGNYWKREWCEELDVYYNCQPCCVFPYNPGRTKMDKAEAERIIGDKQ